MKQLEAWARRAGNCISFLPFYHFFFSEELSHRSGFAGNIKVSGNFPMLVFKVPSEMAKLSSLSCHSCACSFSVDTWSMHELACAEREKFPRNSSASMRCIWRCEIYLLSQIWDASQHHELAACSIQSIFFQHFFPSSSLFFLSSHSRACMWIINKLFPCRHTFPPCALNWLAAERTSTLLLAAERIKVAKTGGDFHLIYIIKCESTARKKRQRLQEF